MNTVLWIVQIVLALAFAGAGGLKLSKPRGELREQMGWVDDFTDSQVKLIGGLEVLGAIGLVLPPAIDVLPVLCPIAAAGLVLTMLGAVATHLRRNEGPMIVPGLVLGAVALFVAIERFGPHAF